MTDSLGTTNYIYDQLSRMTSETRGFTGLGNYAISYQYNLNNDLTSITSPANPGSIAISYTRDVTGRLTAITRPNQTLASAISYRAFGAIEHMLYGDNSTMDVTFNSRLLPATSHVPGKISKTYSYYDDGSLRFSSDAIDHRFDRSYGFDHARRVKNAFSGAEARGEGTTSNRPYYQTYGYDAFGHLNQRTVKTWSTADFSVSWSFVNNRRLGINWQYDADGRRVHSDNYNAYDASGRNNYIEISGPTQPIGEMTFDGDGHQTGATDQKQEYAPGDRCGRRVLGDGVQTVGEDREQARGPVRRGDDAEPGDVPGHEHTEPEHENAHLADEDQDQDHCGRLEIDRRHATMAEQAGRQEAGQQECGDSDQGHFPAWSVHGVPSEVQAVCRGSTTLGSCRGQAVPPPRSNLQPCRGTGSAPATDNWTYRPRGFEREVSDESTGSAGRGVRRGARPRAIVGGGRAGRRGGRPGGAGHNAAMSQPPQFRSRDAAVAADLIG